MTDNYRLINSSHDVFLSRDVTNQTRFRIAFELKSPRFLTLTPSLRLKHMKTCSHLIAIY